MPPNPHPDLMSYLLCGVVGGSFAFLQNLSVNRGSRASWRKRMELLIINVLCGIGGGILVTPLAKLAVPHLGVEVRIIGAAFAGWFGLDTVMNVIKQEKEKHFPDHERSLPHVVSENQLNRGDPAADAGRRSIPEKEQ